MTNFVFNNFGDTTLAAPLGSSGTTMTVASAALLPGSIPGGFVLAVILNDAATEQIYEIVYCTAISGTTLTVTRGQEGTTAQNWNVGDFAFTGPTAAMFASVAPSVGSTGSVNALKITKASNTTLTIAANSATLITTSGSPLFVAPVSLTLNAATNGVDGLDTGSLAASTIYYVHLISNGSGVHSLLSLSAMTPTYPAGYNYHYRVGAVVTDGSGNFYNTQQDGDVVTFVVGASGNTTALPQVITGVQGSVSVPTWAAASIASVVPPTAKTVMLVLFCTAGVGGNNRTMAAPNNTYGAITNVVNPPPLVNWPAADNTDNIPGEFVLESTTTVYYASDVANSGLAVKGWRDNLST